MNISRRDFINALIISVIANALTTIAVYLFAVSLNFVSPLSIPPEYAAGMALLLSMVVSIIVISRNYQAILNRWYYIKFLREDSASKSFDLLADMAKRILDETSIKSLDRKPEEYFLQQLDKLIEKRRQPMQIIAVDCRRLVDRTNLRSSQLSIEEQILYYLDFMKAYKRMAVPRIVRQACLYFETFGTDGYTDYAMTYGHSTNVLNAIAIGYKINPFPIIVIEDLQYHEESLEEHKIVCDKLEKANIPYYLISFEQIRQLFDLSVPNIKDRSGRSLPLLRRRRLHAFIGCERVDVQGNTLVPSESKGIPSETAQFIQELEAFSHNLGQDGVTIARLVILSESYKIRDFDKLNDTRTHIPLKGARITSWLYVLGFINKMPVLRPVSLYNVHSKDIYVHINELGIFPNRSGKFDLKFCTDIFETETNLLGFFSEPRYLVYHMLDEIKAVLFDFNGVIINDEQVHFMAFQGLLRNYGVELNFEDYEKYCQSKSDADGFRNLRDQFNLNIDIDSSVQEKHNIYLKSLASAGVQTFPGVRRLISELKHRGYALAVVTASNRQEVEAALNYLDLKTFFDLIITDDDVAEGKPSAEGYAKAMTQLKLIPSRCVVIEDSPLALKNASNIGMKTIGVRNGRNVNFDCADYVLESLEGILTN